MKLHIFITGASRGLGLSLVQVALERGHTVHAGIRRLENDSILYKWMKEYPDKLYTYSMDVREETSIATISKQIDQKFGSLDVLINNAGVLAERGKGIEELNFDEVNTTLDINLIGPMKVVKHFLPLLYKGSNQVMVNISSDAGSLQNAYGGDFPYGISKAALNMFTFQVSRYVKDKDIRVYAIHPGWIKTDMGGNDATGYPKDSANGILNIVEGKTEVTSKLGYIDFNGKEMTL